VNVGVAVAAEDAFSMRASGEIFSEQADFAADYSLPRGASFDFGGGVMITPIIGVGVSFSGTAHEDIALLSARIPHPRIFNVYATDDAPTDQVLQRIESGVNLQAMIVPVQSPHFRFRVFGGPTFFRVQQDAVTDIRYEQNYLLFLPVNTIEITEFDHERIEATGWGFHGGADASFFFNRVVGVGGFAKFSRGSVDLENTLATAIGDDRGRQREGRRVPGRRRSAPEVLRRADGHESGRPGDLPALRCLAPRAAGCQRVRILRPRASRPQVSAPFPDVGRDLVGGHDLGHLRRLHVAELDPQFGRGARVLAPAALVEWITEELAETGRQYGDAGQLPAVADDMQPPLPSRSPRWPGPSAPDAVASSSSSAVLRT
jgi:hypothetical protein